ncbi:TRAUB-domain-containing protein [Cylindrobasidium torrendii FP15055 ss-10]|uniref:Protein BFR2 n=1 Tax=Cylindrobasidium torrendii FP15055 ss-10 TaxID=1314674 RepID=A0A0D7BKP3_9AGAR|nr:TRAUB-domain-containing protein [Cylindrobasidium torrendii FP15055 ss-10]
MAARLSLAEQLAQIDSAAPVEFDPENAETGAGNEALDLDAGRGHYIDVGPSTLRKAGDSILDPKYSGAKVSRKDLLDQEDESDSEGEESALEDDPMNDGPEEQEDEEQEEDEEDEEEGQSVVPRSHSAKRREPLEDVQPHSNHSDNLQDTLKRNRDQDRRKGQAVAQQLSIWDSLVDARIRLQKAVTAANRVPPNFDVTEQPEGVKESLAQMLQEAMLLSEDLFDLQESMFDGLPPRKRRRIEDDDTIDSYGTYLQEASTRTSLVEQQQHPELVQTLNKWSAKIQAVSPAVLLPSNRNTFSKKSQNLKSAVQLIADGLHDQDKLLKRTQIWRGKGDRLGERSYEGGGEHDTHIFDDTDFYQQLLRDVIDSKSGSGGAGEDWLLAQKQRKAKKKVDTKASKGRKIRYDVHEKLQNFMVPITIRGAWPEQQIDELFASLLGLGAEPAGVSDVQMKEDAVVKQSLQDGFKLFG